MPRLLVPRDTNTAPVWAGFFAAIARKFTAGADVAVVTTIDAVDPTTTQALVNELKAKVNSLIEAQSA